MKQKKILRQKFLGDPLGADFDESFGGEFESLDDIDFDNYQFDTVLPFL